MSETVGDFRKEAAAAGRVVGKGLLLLLPFAVLIVLELFVLPLDFFTFRVWEAASSMITRYPGAFYPDLHITKAQEYGDRYREGGAARTQSKPVTWYTDHYGWRNRPEVEQQPRYDVVVLGDSNIVGSFLDQRDTLTEVMSARGNVTAYSYSIGSDHVSLFFSDPRMVQKSPKLLVVESKVGNWDRNNSYLYNFRQRPDGTLDLIDRSTEMDIYYDPKRDRTLARLESQWAKQPLWHWLKATLGTEFFPPSRDNGARLTGAPAVPAAPDVPGWRSLNWVTSNAVTKPLPGEPQTALAIRAAGSNAYWHTDAFRANAPDGRITLRFEAKTSVSPSRNRVYVFEDKSYRQIGDLVATNRWQSYVIPVTTKPGSSLELQIDQPDAWQWLAIRNFRVEGAGQEVSPDTAAVRIPMAGWARAGVACDGGQGKDMDCVSWPVSGKGDYVQSPPLPPPGPGGYLVRFEARVDQGPGAFSAVYVFEGPDYRKVAQYGYASEWQSFSLPVAVEGARPVKLQLDLPETAGRLSVRNFQVMPVKAVDGHRGEAKP